MSVNNSFRFSVAPMMDCTDRHCRYFHRLLTKRALLYTEMVSSAALVRGSAAESLHFNSAEPPLALQLGGADPGELGESASMGAKAGFNEINLNAGCPSDKVRKGSFGAALMLRPDLAKLCLESMIKAAGGVEVTVKCRIGVDDQDPEIALPRFLEAAASAGVRRTVVHARKALLSGLNPKQNRSIPPLDYGLVLRMKDLFPGMAICLNGGIADLDSAEKLLGEGFDGVMLGRAAYRTPYGILADVDRRIFGCGAPASRRAVSSGMLDYSEQEVRAGTAINRITRHMLGLYAGCKGAKSWRQTLADGGRIAREGPVLLAEAVKSMGGR